MNDYEDDNSDLFDGTSGDSSSHSLFIFLLSGALIFIVLCILFFVFK